MHSQRHAEQSPGNPRQYRFGAQPLAGGGARFRLWAPAHAQLKLEWRGERHDMRARVGGWHECMLADAAAGDRYSFVLRTGGGRRTRRRGSNPKTCTAPAKWWIPPPSNGR